MQPLPLLAAATDRQVLLRIGTSWAGTDDGAGSGFRHLLPHLLKNKTESWVSFSCMGVVVKERKKKGEDIKLFSF